MESQPLETGISWPTRVGRGVVADGSKGKCIASMPYELLAVDLRQWSGAQVTVTEAWQDPRYSCKRAAIFDAIFDPVLALPAI